MGCEGTRMPMLSCPPVTMSLTLSALGRISVRGPGQNCAASCFRNRRHVRYPAMQVARIVQVHDHRMIGRTALDLEDLAHGGGIGGIGAESIDGLGRKHHQVARAQRFDGFFDFCLCSSYHARMISRLRCQQSSHTARIGRTVRHCSIFRGKCRLCVTSQWCQLSSEAYIP